jgi:hypothetical protein
MTPRTSKKQCSPAVQVIIAHRSRSGVAVSRQTDKCVVLWCSGMIVFKLERERPAYTTHGSTLYYIKDRYLRTYDFTNQRDNPLISIRRGPTSGAQPDGAPLTLCKHVCAHLAVHSWWHSQTAPSSLFASMFVPTPPFILGDTSRRLPPHSLQGCLCSARCSFLVAHPSSHCSKSEQTVYKASSALRWH